MQIRHKWIVRKLRNTCCVHHIQMGVIKRSFFLNLVLRLENWKILAESLRKHGATYNATKVVESEFGTRYSVDGLLKTPDSRNPYVRTVWIIEKQSTTPRLITAPPK